MRIHAFSLRQEMILSTKNLKNLLQNNINQPSRSPYNSSVWVILKKKGSNKDGTPKQRMPISYRKLNEITKFYRYVIPISSIILSILGSAKTALDLNYY